METSEVLCFMAIWLIAPLIAIIMLYRKDGINIKNDWGRLLFAVIVGPLMLLPIMIPGGGWGAGDGI